MIMMHGRTIKELHGHSGSKVYLKEIAGVYCVQKEGNTERNVERMSALAELGYRVPKYTCQWMTHYSWSTFMD